MEGRWAYDWENILEGSGRFRWLSRERMRVNVCLGVMVVADPVKGYLRVFEWRGCEVKSNV